MVSVRSQRKHWVETTLWENRERSFGIGDTNSKVTEDNEYNEMNRIPDKWGSRKEFKVSAMGWGDVQNDPKFDKNM